MKLNELFEDDRAISPVVGVALLIAITVILAAVIGGVVLGIGVGPTESPSAQLDAEFTNTSVTITHGGGDPLTDGNVIVRDGTNEVDLNIGAGESEVLGTAGNGTNLSVGPGDEISVVWQDPEGDQETVIATFENSSA